MYPIYSFYSTTDGNALIELLRKTKPILFTDVALNERKGLNGIRFGNG